MRLRFNQKIIKFLSLFFLLADPVVAAPAPLVVNNGADGGPGSLRAIILSSAAGDNITFAGHVTNIALLTPIDIRNKHIILDSPHVVTIDGGQANRAFIATGPATLSLGSNLTIKDCQHSTATAAAAYGGAVHIAGSLNGDIASNFTGNKTSVVIQGMPPSALGGAVYVFGSYTGNVSGAFDSNSAAATGQGQTATGGGSGIYVGGAFTGNISASFTNNSVNASSQAASAYGHGAARLHTFTGNISGAFSANRAQASSQTGQAVASGGGIYASSITGNVTSAFTGNSIATATNNSGTRWSYARGGGLYAEAVRGNISGGFNDNRAQASSQSSSAQVRGGALYATSIQGGLYSAFNNNSVEGTVNNGDATTSAQAYGGGAYVTTIVAADGEITSNFNGNTASASGNAGVVVSHGGGMYAGAVTGNVTGVYTNNTASASSQIGDVYNSGGGLFVNDELTGDVSAIFTNNTASASSQSGQTGAHGGGMNVGNNTPNALNGNLNATFTNNSASASSQSGQANASGGGANARNLNGIVEGSFIGNSARAESQSGQANAYGGGLFVSSPGANDTTLTLKNALFTNNTASAHGVAGAALGGGMALNTTDSNSITVNLLAEAGKSLLFSGNTASLNGVSQPSGIAMVRYDNLDSEANALLNVQGDGQVLLHDPMTVDMNNSKTFAFHKANAGLLHMSGDNNWNAEGGATFAASAGTVVLDKSFTLRSSLNNPLVVQLGAATLIPQLHGRERQLAMFSNPSGMTANGTTITASYIGFADINDAWLVASGTNTPAIGDFTVLNPSDNFLRLGLVGGSGTDLYLQANNAGLANWLNNYPNILSDRKGLNQVFQSTLASLPAEQHTPYYQAIKNNIVVYSQEANLTQGQVALDTSSGIASQAWNMFQISRRDNACLVAVDGLEALAVKAKPLHVFAGYLGNSSHQGDVDNYQGYNSRLSGLVVGAGYDFNPNLSAGAYLAFGTGKTVYDSLHADVESQTWQGGLFGQYLFESGFDLRADLSYASTSNDSTRNTPVPGGWASNSGDYNQQVFGVGAALGYDFTPWQNGTLTPYLELRYQHLQQDEFSESGSVWAMKLDSTDADSFTSVLGVEVKHEIVGGNCITFTPSLNVAWVHEFADNSISGRNAFVNAPGWYDAVSVSSDRDRARVGAMLSLGMLDYNWLSFKLGYEGEFGANSQSHSLFGGLEMKF